MRSGIDKWYGGRRVFAYFHVSATSGFTENGFVSEFLNRILCIFLQFVTLNKKRFTPI